MTWQDLLPTDNEVADILEKKERYLVPSDTTLTQATLKVTKALFQAAFKTAQKPLGPLEDLTVEGFTPDLIWEQIQLRNHPFLKHCNSAWNSIRQDVLNWNLLPGDEDAELKDGQFPDSDDENVEGEEEEEGEEDLNASDSGIDLETDNESSSDMAPNQPETLSRPNNPVEHKKKKTRKSSEVDDPFFSLEQMEEFLDDEDEKEFGEFGDEEEEAQDGSDEDHIHPMDDDDMEVNDEDKESEEEEEDLDLAMEDDDDDGEIRYEDFFGSKEDLEEEIEEENLGDKPPKTLKKTPEQKESKSLFDDEESDNEDVPLSTFEKKQKSLQKKIQEVEEELIAEKKWALKGEVDSKLRPVNSLLEEVLEFDHNKKAVPVITEEVTESLEELIKRRIKENLFDDVERKVVIETKAPKPKLEVSDQKSSLSLGEVYEQDYLTEKLKQKGSQPYEVSQETEKEHQEIESFMNYIFEKLDGLSNWHYKPKTIDATIEVVHDVPALTLEEVTPHSNHVGADSRLAPQEIYSKKRKLVEFKGESELTKEEKKSKRQQSKKEFSERKKSKEAYLKAKEQKRLEHEKTT